MVNIFLTYDPIYQPYKPIKYSILKECGGRPVGLNVYRGVYKEIADLDSGTKKKMPVFPEDAEEQELNLGIHDGVFMSQFANTDPKEGTGIVPEEERETTFFLDVPPTEIEHGYGNRTAPATPCRATWLGGNVGNFMLHMILATPTQYVRNASRTSAAAICSASSRGLALVGRPLEVASLQNNCFRTQAERYRCTSRMAAPAKPKF